MIRRLLLLALTATLISSCNTGKKAPDKTGEAGNSEKVEFSALAANPGNYVGKQITVEGKVVHVCTETGKKMFIVGDNPDIRLFVAAGENISKFPMELLGSEIAVEGIITRVSEAAPSENEKEGKGMEPMHKAESAGKIMGGDSCETETALKQQPTLANFAMQYKSHIVKQKL
jgi:hypothetical protein